MGEADIATVTRPFGIFTAAHLARSFDAQGKEVAQTVVEKQPDSALRDTENVPLSEDVKASFGARCCPMRPTPGLIMTRPGPATRCPSTATSMSLSRHARWPRSTPNWPKSPPACSACWRSCPHDPQVAGLSGLGSGVAGGGAGGVETVPDKACDHCSVGRYQFRNRPMMAFQSWTKTDFGHSRPSRTARLTLSSVVWALFAAASIISEVSVRPDCPAVDKVGAIVSALESGHCGVMGGSAHEAALDA